MSGLNSKGNVSFLGFSLLMSLQGNLLAAIKTTYFRAYFNFISFPELFLGIRNLEKFNKCILIMQIMEIDAASITQMFIIIHHLTQNFSFHIIHDCSR